MIRTYALWGGSPLSRIILIILIIDVIVSALLPHRRVTEANIHCGYSLRRSTYPALLSFNWKSTPLLVRYLFSSFEKMEPSDDFDSCFMLTCRCRSRYRMHEDRKLQLHRFHRVLVADCQRNRCVYLFDFPILPHLPSAIPPIT